MTAPSLPKARCTRSSSNSARIYRIQEPLAGRRTLPLPCWSGWLPPLPIRLHEFLVKRGDLPPGTASDLVLSIRERATAGLLTAILAAEEALRLAHQLNGAGRLTASLILRHALSRRSCLHRGGLAELTGVSGRQCAVADSTTREGLG